MLKKIALNKNTHLDVTRSGRERDIEKWLKSQGYTVIINDKTLLGDKELDILLPDHNMAFEFNGVLYHWSEFNSYRPIGKPHPKDYHKSKTIKCLNKGVALYHFWDFESLDSVKRQIKRLLQGKQLSCVNVDKNPFIVNNSVLIPLYYIYNSEIPITPSSILNRCPSAWKDKRIKVYKFYNSGFVINKLLNATL